MFNPNRISGNEVSGRDIPSFIEPRPPSILNPFMRPRPNKGTNLLELFEEDSECEEPELVQVYLRLKPCNTKSNLYEVRSERCLITSLDTTTAGHGRRTQHNVSKMYTFSHIFKPDCPQKEIFEHVVKHNLKKLPEGQSFTLLTYGASGSGKTYTLMGTVASPGLVPRSLEYVFNIVEAAQRPRYKPSETGADVLSHAEQDYELQWVKGLRQVSAPLREKYRRMSASLHSTLSSSHIDLTSRTKHYVWVSFIEIYNEGIYDLLVPCDRRTASKLNIREDSSGNVYVKGATQAFVKSGEEAYDVMVAGKHNLQVAATGVHAQSSRSHCIFTITMLTEIDGAVRSACVRLCDLAGCERAARTRNTGARMQESRAINSSLHVLERCLHTLRRRQTGRRALVPYRESKLTRLLGAGLSGARGEAVSMVVTLNPAPEYAHETRHVLQLAAVAKDIQVNNTISEYPSSLETSQDSTVCPSAEVMKLRADNERLRFEMARSEAWYKEELARIKSQQPTTNVDTWALVEEAKQITKQYYEDRLLNLKRQNEELAEEQETKEAELLMKITVLEEMISAEKLARARIEEEMVHLRACIEERDEKLSEHGNDDDVMSLDEYDNSDNETDPFNESLEPTFKKEDLNRSKLIRQSLANQEKCDDRSLEESNESCNDSVLEKSTDTLKDQDSRNNSTVDSTYATGTEISESNIDKSVENLKETENIIEKVLNEKKENVNINDNSNISNKTSLFSRSTYCVVKDNSLYESSAEATSDVFDKINKDTSKINTQGVTEDIIVKKDNFKVPDKPFVYSILNSLKKRSENNNSLVQFESLEKETKEYENTQKDMNVNFDSIKILKERKNFFYDGETVTNNLPVSEPEPNLKETKSFFDDDDKLKNVVKEVKDDYRSPSIVRDECLRDYEPESKQLLGEHITNPVETTSIKKSYFFNRKHESLDVFDSPKPQANEELLNVDDIRKSIAKVNISNKNNEHKNHIDTSEKDLATNTTSKSHDQTEDDKISMACLVSSKNIDIDNVDKEDSIIEKTANCKIIELSKTCKITVNKSTKEMSSKKEEDKHCMNEVENGNRLELREKAKLSENLGENIILESTAKNYKCFEISGDKSIGDIKIEQSNKAQINRDVMDPQVDKTLKESEKNTDKNNLELSGVKVDNTLEEFENIYKEVTIPRSTEFDLLVSQSENETQIGESDIQENTDLANTKYNLRNKSKTERKPRRPRAKHLEDEVVMESVSKCESSTKPIRKNLRLRRKKNTDEDSMELDREDKLKDIVNLQTEFSDITMDVPAQEKIVKDIPSPEKQEEENVPPALGIQSCPSKLSTRGRRKLFTPRAEPIDESVASGEGDERIRVPRPSYHRPRARRKL